MSRHILLLILFVTAPAFGQVQQQFAAIGDLPLESGEVLRDVRVGFIAVGTLNEDESNILVFPTWFGGTARNLIDFGIIGPGKLADTSRYYVIAIDALGNGVSTSPSNSAQQPGAKFPAVTIGDMVESQYRLLTGHLGIGHVHAVMGISMGGMQTFDWMGRYPDFMEHALPMDGSPRMTSYDLLQWQVHRDIVTVMRDAGHNDEDIFELVGRVSQMTLQTPAWFVQNVKPGELEGYLAARSGTRDSYDYIVQLDAMIQQNVFGHSDASRREWLDRVVADVLVVGGTRDHMVNQVPAQRAAAELGAEVFMNDSYCGHLGGGCERDTLVERVRGFLQ